MSFFPDLKTFASIGGISITWYAICVLGGAVLAYYLSLRQVRKWGYKDQMLEDFFLMMMPIVIIGARIYYVIFDWSYYSNNINEIWKIWNGGLAIHGGLMVGLITIIIYAKKYRLRFVRYLDFVVPG